MISNDNGAVPLFIACQKGHTEIVTKLLAANADVNQGKNEGATPLQRSPASRHTEIVTKLIGSPK